MFDRGLYREKHGKIFYSETLIFGKEHDLVELYQVCSKYNPGAKIGLAPGVNRDLVSFQQIPVRKL